MKGINIKLYNYVKERYPNFVNGGELEKVAIANGFKGSYASRECRKLAQKGLFERREPNGSVEYRVNPTNQPALL